MALRLGSGPGAVNPLSVERLEELMVLATERRGLPDLEVTMELCDWIKKKHNGPAFAAEALFKRIHGRNPQVSLNALAVLDAAVKNCGIPFHLHIATKKFLNELVRFFPEKCPNPKPPVIERILELIQLWNFGLVPKSRHKSDLTNISSMYKLLKNKGYVFPKYKEAEAALILTDPALLTEEELEKEDHVVQAAKLDELLRRGAPEDLAAANELMKVMAGYDPDTKPDYKKQVDEQLKKIEYSCQELLDVIMAIVPGEPLDSFKLLDDLASVCRGSQPKIQGFIQEEDDGARIDNLLRLNDRINAALQGYECIRAGRAMPPELWTTLNVPPPQPARSSPAQRPQPPPQPRVEQAPAQNTAGSTSLIDFELDPTIKTSSSSASPAKPGDMLSDLAGLSVNSFDPYGQAPATTTPAFHPNILPPPTQSMFPGFTPVAGTMLAQSPPKIVSVPKSTSDNMNFAAFPPPPYSESTPVASGLVPVPTQSAAALAPVTTSTPAGPPIAFEASSPASIAPTPFPPPPPAAFVAMSIAEPSSPKRHTAAPFPSTHDVTVHESDAIKIVMEMQKADDQINCKASIYNKLSAAITNVNLQLAVPKTQKLALEPMSSSTVAPANMGGRPVTQQIVIENPSRAPVRIRFRLSYDIPGKQAGVSEQGEFLNIPAFFGA